MVGVLTGEGRQAYGGETMTQPCVLVSTFTATANKHTNRQNSEDNLHQVVFRLALRYFGYSETLTQKGFSRVEPVWPSGVALGW